MNSVIQAISITGSILVMLLVAQLIRRRKLRAEYAILWLAASLALMVVSLWRGAVDYAARLVGIAYPPSLLILAVIVVGFLTSLHFSISLSRLADQNKCLTQHLAILRHEVEWLSHSRSAGSAPGEQEQRQA